MSRIGTNTNNPFNSSGPRGPQRAEPWANLHKPFAEEFRVVTNVEVLEPGQSKSKPNQEAIRNHFAYNTQARNSFQARENNNQPRASFKPSRKEPFNREVSNTTDRPSTNSERNLNPIQRLEKLEGQISSALQEVKDLRDIIESKNNAPEEIVRATMNQAPEATNQARYGRSFAQSSNPFANRALGNA